MVLELIASFANAAIALAVAARVSVRVGRSIEVRELLFGERPLQLILELGE
jgi:hypothetical protein